MSANMRIIIISGMILGAIIGATVAMIFSNDATYGVVAGTIMGGFLAVPASAELDPIEVEV